MPDVRDRQTDVRQTADVRQLSAAALWVLINPTGTYAIVGADVVEGRRHLDGEGGLVGLLLAVPDRYQQSHLVYLTDAQHVVVRLVVAKYNTIHHHTGV